MMKQGVVRRPGGYCFAISAWCLVLGAFAAGQQQGAVAVKTAKATTAVAQ